MLIKVNQINESQLKELEELKNVCMLSDQGLPNLYQHLLIQERILPAIILYYEKNQLVALLSIYFFYKDAVEVALLVHPSFRRKGIAKQLLINILPDIEEQGYLQLIFSRSSYLQNQWLSRLGFSYQHSEYYMERNDHNPLLNYKNYLTFRRATMEDIPLLCTLDEACFFNSQEQLIPRFHHILSDRSYEIIIAFENGTLIGKAHIRWDKKGATLSDIAVIPAQQGKGLGTSLITYCVNYALSEGKSKLSLDVETQNQKALHLYTRLGFQTQNASDYWKINISQLKRILGL